MEQAGESNLLVGGWEVGVMYSLWRVSLLLLCNMVATNTIQRVTVNIPGKGEKQTNKNYLEAYFRHTRYRTEKGKKKGKKTDSSTNSMKFPLFDTYRTFRNFVVLVDTFWAFLALYKNPKKIKDAKKFKTKK